MNLTDLTPDQLRALLKREDIGEPVKEKIRKVLSGRVLAVLNDMDYSRSRRAGQKASDNELLSAYLELRSVRAVASRFGMAGQSVHERLKKLGVDTTRRAWTDDELAKIRELYERGFKRGDGQLKALARDIDRSVPLICRKAKEIGLTNQSRAASGALLKRMSDTTKKRIAKKGHPRGMAGKRHTTETKRRISEHQRALAAMGMLANQRFPITQETRDAMSRAQVERHKDGRNPYSRTKSGRRADLGDAFFRSRWEANYARYLNLLIQQGVIKRWEFEPDTFWFEKIKRGVRSYTPDFKVWEPGGHIYYVEVKGWMDTKSRTKLRRMKKYHPGVDLRLVDAKAYREIERKLAGAIPGWEQAA